MDELGSRMDELRIGSLDQISELPDLFTLRIVQMNELISRMYELRNGGLDRISELPNLTEMEELGSRIDEQGIGGLDRISELPDHLLHHILSFIPMQDVVQTCFLSRSWRRVCYSNPIFQFILHSYCHPFDQRYIKFFDNAMQRFHRYETGMQKLYIFASIKGGPEFVRMVDRWIEISLEKNVQELDIQIYRYDLPQSIFASKSLHTLCLSGIMMPSIFTTYTRVFSLRKLSLYNVSLKEQTLQYLIFKFPFIENLTLKGGGGDGILINPQKIRIFGLCNLKEFTIFAWQALEEIDIDAPSLKFFHYDSGLGMNNIEIKTGSTKNVETLSITHDATITYQRFHDLISKFPLLKCLHVEQCRMLKEIKISSNQLQRFSFVDSFFMPSLVKAEIDAPNLIFFKYSGRVEPGAMLLVKTPPSCSKAHINLEYHVDRSCFISLREFLTSSMQFKFLSLQISEEKYIISKFSEQLLPLPYQVEQLQINLLSPPSTYAAILDNLLQICRPMTIIALQDHYELFKKYLYNALLSREDLSCCNSRLVKCWKHYLKDVKIRSRIEGIEVERPICLKTMPTLKWTLKRNKKICLILKWS